MEGGELRIILQLIINMYFLRKIQQKIAKIVFESRKGTSKSYVYFFSFVVIYLMINLTLYMAMK